MELALNETESLIIQSVQRFCDENLRPNASRFEEEENLSREVLSKAADLGLGGLYVNEASGGLGLSRFVSTLIFEELSKGCISHAAFISIHNMCAKMIDAFASDEFKAEFLPAIIGMEKIVSYCLTEPDSGSDAASMKTTAQKFGDKYILNGTKTFISGAGFSDHYLVMAKTGEINSKEISAFLLDKGMYGLSFGKKEKKMGWRAQPTAQVIMDNLEISESRLIGVMGKGFTYAMAGLDGGRLNIAACALGGAEEAFVRALNYSKERKQFGKEIFEFQNTQFKLADMATELEACRHLLHHAAQSLDARSFRASQKCAMAKRFVTDTCYKIANDALQIHGGYGYLKDYEVERIVRDLRVHMILEGTNEIMRVIISRGLR